MYAAAVGVKPPAVTNTAIILTLNRYSLMKNYVQILTCDGEWITYAVREDYHSADMLCRWLEQKHNFETYQIRIVK